MDNLSTMASVVEEKKVNVDGIDINYARTGEGEHAVLLLPGMLGSIWLHFKPQINNLNKEKLTIIAWDPPGYGKSRPPNRTYPKNYYERDATIARNLMKILGFDKFSLLGYSGGGITALTLAAMYPENVQKMITIGPHSYITPALMTLMEALRDINFWSKKERAAAIAVFGEEYFKDTLSVWADRQKYFFEDNHGDVCNGLLSKIKCPTLIVYGERDEIISREQIDYVQANVMNSKLVILKNAPHHLHLKRPDEFNALVHEFLLDQERIH